MGVYKPKVFKLTPLIARYVHPRTAALMCMIARYVHQRTAALMCMIARYVHPRTAALMCICRGSSTFAVLYMVNMPFIASVRRLDICHQGPSSLLHKNYVPVHLRRRMWPTYWDTMFDYLCVE